MTVHALVVDPPRPGLALPALVSSDEADDSGQGLGASGAAALAEAMIQDAAVGAENSGGDLLVNHPTESQLPEAHRTGTDPATELRVLFDEALSDPDAVRFEPQVGSSFDARVGNTVTHLLREEDADSVAVLDGRAPTLDRTVLDSAAMKLRRSEAVLAPAPAPAGGVAYLGLTEPIDFADAWSPPALGTLVDRALDAGHDVDFLPMHPRVDDPSGLASLVGVVEARRVAGRRVPEHTAAAIASLGIRLGNDGSVRVGAGATDRA